MGTRRKDSAVKVDAELLSGVEEFIKKGKNKLLYANKKQFVDIAIYEKLEKKGKQKKRKKSP